VTEKSISELIRDHIHNQFDNDYDYTIKSNIINDKSAIIESFRLDKKKGEDLYVHQFHKVVKQRRLDIKKFISTRIRLPKSDLKATIKPVPQYFYSEPEPDPVEQIKQKITLEQPEIQQLQQKIQVELKNEHLTPKSIEGVVESIWSVLKIKWPLEQLTNEEKDSLSKMWLPSFKKYLNENWAYIGIPFLSTLGIFGPKIAKARKLKKEKTLNQISIIQS